MLPQLGVSGGIPDPRKLRNASVRIAVPQLYVACTASGASVDGRMWRNMTRGSVQPVATAASTKGHSRMDRTSDRTTRLTRGVCVTTAAAMTLPTLAPEKITRAIAEQHGRDRHQRVHDPHDRDVQAPDGARQEPDDEPEQRGDGRHRDTDHEGDPPAVERAAEQIPADGVAAEEVSGSRRLELELRVQRDGIGRREQRRARRSRSTGGQERRRPPPSRHDAEGCSAAGESVVIARLPPRAARISTGFSDPARCRRGRPAG